MTRGFASAKDRGHESSNTEGAEERRRISEATESLVSGQSETSS